MAAVVVVIALGAACSDDSNHQSGEIFGHTGDGPREAAQPTPGETVILAAPPGTTAATLSAAADVVRGRLARMGIGDADVSAGSDGVAVRSSADGFQLHAAAQQRATALAPIESTTVGPCAGPGNPSLGAAARCYVLGATLAGTGAISDVKVQPASGAGWKITFAVDPDQYHTLRDAVATAGQNPLALVSDGAVIVAIGGGGLPALQSEIGPPLDEDTARLAAAALVVTDDLPVALQAPPLPAATGARVDVDFWTAALGVDICGTWLPNAPASGLDTGVHSHGDGLVYIHPFKQDEAGDHANLGLFLKRGGWSASADRLDLWDGTEHATGGTCPNGQPAQIRWTVDGVEQHGNPSDYLPRNGQVIVLSYNTALPGPPPQLSSLYLPLLGAAS